MTEQDMLALRQKTILAYHLNVFKNGIHRLKKSRLRLAISLAICYLLYILLYILWVKPVDGGIPTHLITAPVAVILCIFLTLAVIYINGYEKDALKFYDDFMRIGFYNEAGEAPLLLSTEKMDNGIIRYDFNGVGFPRYMWADTDRKQQLETVFNHYIAEIKDGADMRTISLSITSDREPFREVMWSDSLINWLDDSKIVLGKGLVDNIILDIDITPMALLGGITGSGKTILFKSIMWQHMKREQEVYIADFKGGADFSSDGWHTMATLITDEEQLLNTLKSIINELERRKKLFAECKVSKIQKYREKYNTDLKRIIVGIDEIAEVLDRTGATKEQKALIDEIERHISTIARQGRAFGIHLVLCTQRADSSILTGQIKNNLGCRICGRADSILSTIIVGDGRADKEIPDDSRGRFITNDGTVFQGYYFKY